MVAVAEESTTTDRKGHCAWAALSTHRHRQLVEQVGWDGYGKGSGLGDDRATLLVGSFDAQGIVGCAGSK